MDSPDSILSSFLMLPVPIDIVEGEEAVIGESKVFALHRKGSQGPIERSIPREIESSLNLGANAVKE